MYEVEDVEYERITDSTVGLSKSDWRVRPRYRLNSREKAEQEAELWRIFKGEEGEGVRVAGPGEPTCCICRENMATRVVIPCGHRCLCFPCARQIATNRTTFYGKRIAKLCPICQAAIAIMPKLCEHIL